MQYGIHPLMFTTTTTTTNNNNKNNKKESSACDIVNWEEFVEGTLH